jgi:spermidine/putrescine transport system permease protein
LRLGDLFLKIFTAAILILLYTPISVMVLSSFNAGRNLLNFSGFSLTWYERALSNQRILSALFNSVMVAVVVTALAILMAVVTAFAVDRMGRRFTFTYNNLLYVSIIIPEIAEALTLVLFFIWISFPLGVYAVIIGHLVWFPIVYIVIRARLVGMSRVFEEASRVLGASWSRTFFHVTLPLLLPAVVSGGLLIFTWSWDSFLKTQFTRSPGFETLPVYIWNTASGRGRGILPEVNAIATISIAVSLLLAFLYVRFRTRD